MYKALKDIEVRIAFWNSKA